MELKIVKIDTAIKVPINFDAFKMYSSEKIEIINLQFKPNQELPLHNNPADVVFYVISGTGIFLLEDSEIEVCEDSCFEIKSGINRGLINRTDKILKILVIKKLG